MMDEYEILEDQLWDSFEKLRLALGLDTTVIIAHESGLEPLEDYLSIRVVDMEEVASTTGQYLHYNEITGEAGNSITTHYKIPVQITFSGKGSGGAATKVNNTIKKLSEARSIFQSNSLSPLYKSSVRRVPHFRETEWRDIFKLDITFSYAYVTTFTADYADVISFDNLVSGEKFCVNLKDKNYSCEVNE